MCDKSNTRQACGNYTRLWLVSTTTSLFRVLLAGGAVGRPEQLPSYTAQSLTDPEAMQKERETVRRSGVAYDRAEYLEGVAAAAAPGLTAEGKVVRVLYVVGLRDVVGEHGLLRLGQHVREAANVLRRRLSGLV